MATNLVHNISSVGKDCSSCGTCSAICPKNCISCQLDSSIGSYCVEVNHEKCINCGLCARVCPILVSEKDVTNPMGTAITAYAGFSKDKKIRQYAASGGFITSFLLFLLENGYVDGALVSRRNGIVGESYIATTRQEIINSKTSIYAPVDFTKGLKELNETSCQKIAIVGLPCQIQAITNWAKINNKVANKIFIKIAIVCGKTPSTHAYKYISKKIGFKYDNIKSVCNRGDGWPGYMIINYQSGQYKTPYRSKMSMGSVLSSPYLCNRGCLSCIDGLGVSADLSVCDAWLKKYTQKKDDGWNLILAMTKKSVELLTTKSIMDFLHLEEETIDSFYRANRRVIDKADVGNMMRIKENRNKYINTPLTIKKRIYVLSLKNTLNFFSPNRVNGIILTIGKAINKLKE